MRKVTIAAIVVLAALATVAWRAAPTATGHVIGGATSGSQPVSGAYAFSDTFHDPLTGQEGAQDGSLVFKSSSTGCPMGVAECGTLVGVLSQAARCATPCGDQTVTRAGVTGTFSIYADASATLDLCIANPSSQVRVIAEGAFSTFYFHFRFIFTRYNGGQLLCSPSTLVQIPNVTTGTADKV